ncbi:unnamed protein product, partial [Effrenium voratum]
WGGMDPGEKAKMKTMVKEAQEREQVARKELAEAREDEAKAAQWAKEAKDASAKAQNGGQSKGASSEPSPDAVKPLHSKVVNMPVPSMGEVAAAKKAADKEAASASAAEQEAKLHMQRLQAAQKAAQKAQDEKQLQQAKQTASAESVLAHEAEHNATVKRLEAKIAHDKVRFMEMQSLRGSLQGEPSSVSNYLMIAGVVGLLALCIFLVPGRSKKAKQEPLKEPLLSEEDPAWATEDTEMTAEVFRARMIHVYFDAFCLAALVTSEPFCEEDEETTLLHAQKVLKPNANSSEGQMPGVDRLMLTMLAGSVPAASGLLVPEANGPDLRCLLFRTDGSECGEVQISIGNGSGLEAAFRANTSASFGPTLQANRVPGEFPSRASLTPMPRTFDSASNRPSMTPPTLPPHSRPPTQL